MSDEEDGGQEEGAWAVGREGKEDDSDDGSEEEEEKDDDEGLGAANAWKSRMIERAQSLFSTRRLDLERLIYGERASVAPGNNNASGRPSTSRGGSDEDSDDDLFKPVRKNEQHATKGIDSFDCTRPVLAVAAAMMSMDIDEREELKRTRFVTGDWAAGEARGKARPEGDGPQDEGKPLAASDAGCETSKSLYVTAAL